MQKYRLLIDTTDQMGLVQKISTLLYDNRLNIEKNSEYVDKENKKFFMRTEFSGDVDIEKLKTRLKDTLPQESNINLMKVVKKNIVIFVTKESHALGDILIKYDSKKLDANIVAVVSNHEYLKSLVKKFDIPFEYIGADDLSRDEHEKRVISTLENYKFDYLILAKYMRILTPNFVSTYKDKIVNIHHSFLPAFIGANPYKQAYDRGVKIIGATSHFVTNDLDEGPIIYQDVIRVSHEYSAKDMQSAGSDVEKIVLSKALDLVLNDRVLIYGNKTVIF
jgi:formyltetrahydrofolate deformylase